MKGSIPPINAPRERRDVAGLRRRDEPDPDQKQARPEDARQQQRREQPAMPVEIDPARKLLEAQSLADARIGLGFGRVVTLGRLVDIAHTSPLSAERKVPWDPD
ncbi:hypothetical protein [Halalkalicoccus paucihalophilus]|uniref:hypothetical protein n=1 Tax=Halalkalicoccus paucihalophilus TaxID=1008153 RepID=UPI001B804F2B|nr:hypothetical protein [Halalkalicoccus paucihalophilus]